MPKIVDKEEKRALILDAALRVLARKGVAAATIADIAVAAGVGKGTIYEYFRSKDEIVGASCVYFVEQLETRIMRRLDPRGAPFDRLNAYFAGWKNALTGEVLAEMEIVLEIWAESLRRQRGDIPGFSMAETYAGYRASIQRLLDDCIKSGDLRPHDTRIAASIMIGALDGLLVQAVVDREVFDIRRAVDLLGRTMIEGLRAEKEEKP
jgi:AcrR family transcriptional regulator